MKQVVKYETEDGRLFDTKAAASEHEDWVIAVRRLSAVIQQDGGENPTGTARWIVENKKLILDCLKND